MYMDTYKYKYIYIYLYICTDIIYIMYICIYIRRAAHMSCVDACARVCM